MEDLCVANGVDTEDLWELGNTLVHAIRNAEATLQMDDGDEREAILLRVFDAWSDAEVDVDHAAFPNAIEEPVYDVLTVCLNFIQHALGYELTSYLQHHPLYMVPPGGIFIPYGGGAVAD